MKHLRIVFLWCMVFASAHVIAQTPLGYFVDAEQQQIHHSASLDRHVFVVPVYRELYNGNILRLIESVSKQTSYRFKQIDIVLWVNNTIDAPAHIVTENEETIEVLKLLKQGTMPVLAKDDFANRYFARGILTNRWRINLHVVNATHRYPSRNIGKVRREANEYAISEIAKGRNLERVVLTQLDADSVLESEFSNSIYLALNRPDKSYLLGTLYYTPDAQSSSLIMQRMHIEDANLASWEFLAATENRHLGSGTPRLSLTAELYQRSGGFRELTSGEDTEFIGRLNQNHWQEGISHPGVRVGVNYRGRFDSYDGLLFLQNAERPVDLNEHVLGIREILENKEQQVESWDIFWQQLYRQELENLRSKVDREYQQINAKLQGWLLNFANIKFRKYVKAKRDRSISAFFQLDYWLGLDSYWDTVLSPSPIDHGIFSTSWFPELISNLFESEDDSFKVYDNLKTQFPSIFSSARDTTKDLVIRFRAMTNTIRAHQVKLDIERWVKANPKLPAYQPWLCNYQFAN